MIITTFGSVIKSSKSKSTSAEQRFSKESPRGANGIASREGTIEDPVIDKNQDTRDKTRLVYLTPAELARRLRTEPALSGARRSRSART